MLLPSCSLETSRALCAASADRFAVTTIDARSEVLLTMGAKQGAARPLEEGFFLTDQWNLLKDEEKAGKKLLSQSKEPGRSGLQILQVYEEMRESRVAYAVLYTDKVGCQCCLHDVCCHMQEDCAAQFLARRVSVIYPDCFAFVLQCVVNTGISFFDGILDVSWLHSQLFDHLCNSKIAIHILDAASCPSCVRCNHIMRNTWPHLRHAEMHHVIVACMVQAAMFAGVCLLLPRTAVSSLWC